jgi:hypothetical protein
MNSFYTVVRYVPDPTADERINIGIIAVNEGRIKTRFLRDWSRVKRFGAEDTGFLQLFARTLTFPGDTTLKRGEWTRDYALGLSMRCKGSIQFSEPRASLEPIDVLVHQAARRFLKEAPKGRRYRGKRSAVAVGLREVAEALKFRIGRRPTELIKRNYVVSGELDSHTLDLVVGNGVPQLGAEGLSFEMQDLEALQKDIDTIAWTIDDIRKHTNKLELAVLALPPRAEDDAAHVQLDRAQRVYSGLGATIVLEERIPSWAIEVAHRLPL